MSDMQDKIASTSGASFFSSLGISKDDAGDIVNEYALPHVNNEEEVLSGDFYNAAQDLLKLRLSPARYRHAQSAAATAEKLAFLYGVDPRQARLAGLLHDWDKEYDDDRIEERIQTLGLSFEPFVISTMARLLHGMTAAAALARACPALPPAVVQAIERHTTASTHMSPLDMIIYVADALEPCRSFDDLDALREKMGTVSLEKLFFDTYSYVLNTVMRRTKTFYPNTAEVWNYYVVRVYPHEKYLSRSKGSST